MREEEGEGARGGGSEKEREGEGERRSTLMRVFPRSVEIDDSLSLLYFRKCRNINVDVDETNDVLLLFERCICL